MDERKFTDVVKSIASSEKDVDKVLDAARLLRREGKDRHLSADQKLEIIGNSFLLIGFLALLAFFGFLFTR